MPDTKCIVVADDFEDGRMMVAEFLTLEGYRVVQASNGQEAIHLVREVNAKVVLMDIAMPSMDGLEATRILKGDSRTKDVFVIAVTGRAFKADEELAREAGCDAFLIKPHEMDELLSLVRQAVSQTAS